MLFIILWDHGIHIPIINELLIKKNRLRTIFLLFLLYVIQKYL